MVVDPLTSLSRRQRFEAGVVQALARLPARAQRLLAGPVVEGDYGPLDVQVQLILRLMAANPTPSFETQQVAQARESIRREAAQLAGRRPADVVAAGSSATWTATTRAGASCPTLPDCRCAQWTTGWHRRRRSRLPWTTRWPPSAGW
jgi:hypothetical protein